jgi:DNA sulfur modification protein DndC
VLKVKPMKVVIDRVSSELGCKFLLMSGVRLGESTLRDGKLEKSKQIAYAACSKDSGECGTGGVWMDERMSTNYTALPLIVNWKECHVYDFLQGWFHWGKLKGHSMQKITQQIAWMYGQSEDGLVERSLRFGCFGCPVVTQDRMTMQAAKATPTLTPILELHAVWAEMRKPQYRLWQPSKKSAKGKVGPLSVAARQHFYGDILSIQNRSSVVLMTDADKTAIHSHWENRTFPRGWKGDEPLASDVMQKGTLMETTQ